MSAGPALSAATLAPAAVVTRSAADHAEPESNGLAGPTRSFTEILSAQRAESPHEETARDKTDSRADDKRDAAPEAPSAPAHQGSSSTPSDPVQAPLLLPQRPQPSSSAGAILVPAAARESAVPGAGGSAAQTTLAPVAGSALQEAEGDGGSGHSTHPLAAGSPARSERDTVVASEAAETVTPATSADPAAGTSTAAERGAGVAVASTTVVETVPIAASTPGAAAAPGVVAQPGAAAPAPSLPADGSAESGSAASRSIPVGTADSLPTHGGAPGDSAAAAAHSSSTPAAASTVPGTAPAPTAVTPAQASETALAPAVAMGAPHVTASPIHSGGVAAPSTPSTAPAPAPAAAGSFDVDDLAGSISRPLSDGNGTYTVTVALHPSELGHVQAVMSLAGNDLQVSLTAQTQTGHDALAHAADALKDQLARGGVNVNVTLRDHGSPAGGDEQYRPPAAPGGTGSFVADGAATEVPVSSGLVPSQIHLVL